MDGTHLEPEIRHVSDRSLLLRFGDAISEALHGEVRRAFCALQANLPSDVTNLHPAYASLLLDFDPSRVARDAFERAVRERLTAAPAHLPEPTCHELPVAYGGELGPDLEEVAHHCGLSPEEVVRLHTEPSYLVYFLGFSPGFAYLGGMSPRLATPRRATPRTAVAAGSVGIADAQTGVYPLASPGGWQLIGRTDRALFDPARAAPATLALGDRVRFVPVGPGEAGGVLATSGQPPDGPTPPAGGLIDVLRPGLQTSVQDLGRPGHAHLGVSASGAADPVSLRLGNWLVGNLPDAAALEMTLIGGTFRFPAEAVVALAGSDPGATLDGQPLPPWRPVRVRAGQTLACGPLRVGARCLLCVRGGIAVPGVLGSRSTHLTSGLGGFQGRALRAGDALPIGGEQAPERGERALPEGEVSGLLRRNVLRVVPGAQWEWFSSAARKELLTSGFTVTERSNRMGLRLSGRPLTAVDRTRMLTEGVSLGALQVPGDGQPILSFVEHQTTGGYPQIACVIAADLHRAAHLGPRDEVRFELVSLAGADSARRELESWMARWLERR